jgi:hypothetical protein
MDFCSGMQILTAEGNQCKEEANEARSNLQLSSNQHLAVGSLHIQVLIKTNYLRVHGVLVY